MTNIVKSKFMFCDGSNIYKKYKSHKNGFVILGPPGSGKTTFCKNQNVKNWTDSDNLLYDLGVKWRQNTQNDIDFKLNYARADYMLEQSKQLGYRIIGSLFWDYCADVIVLPPLSIHKSYINKRKDLQLKSVLEIRKILTKAAKKYKIPVFKNYSDATTYLESL
jgi:hypothetical protein